MGCKNCEERWRIFLANESKNNYIMAKQEKPAEEVQETNFQETSSEAPKQVSVPAFQKPDVNKIIDDRRKVIESGKQVNK